MHKIVTIAYLLSLFYSVAWPQISQAEQLAPPSRFISYIVDNREQSLAFYWRDEHNRPYRSFQNVQSALSKQNKTLLFAMNGGIFQEDYTPLGLYIEQGVVKHHLNRRQHAYGNFYIQPNGIFYVTDLGQGVVVPTAQFKHDASIQYATQSGPMLVVDGSINPNLIKGSMNLRIRNGVGILPDGHLLFAISKTFVSFYDFADYFKQQGCSNALYLDGTISQVYIAENNLKVSGGSFGVIIAATLKALE
jgi:uncharacterized protein YigE (DUF2233 family)